MSALSGEAPPDLIGLLRVTVREIAPDLLPDKGEEAHCCGQAYDQPNYVQ
ncbi:MAG: hypothetical protein JRG89_19775 [Deltaproteobacteria bacterium]|nr:hypothetical protein [Deltaproteobacteria bacterium]MBW2390648.1 hypothetical protein [Deltaproteobacteria bacterium]MBW2725535.1 hypothetical protein [Deltaproteobacteria bacterium]